MDINNPDFDSLKKNLLDIIANKGNYVDEKKFIDDFNVALNNIRNNQAESPLNSNGKYFAAALCVDMGENYRKIYKIIGVHRDIADAQAQLLDSENNKLLSNPYLRRYHQVVDIRPLNFDFDNRTWSTSNGEIVVSEEDCE